MDEFPDLCLGANLVDASIAEVDVDGLFESWTCLMIKQLRIRDLNISSEMTRNEGIINMLTGLAFGSFGLSEDKSNGRNDWKVRSGSICQSP